MGNALGIGQHAQQLRRVGMIERDLFLARHGDQRGPGTSRQGRHRRGSRRVHRRLPRQLLRHGRRTLGLGSSARDAQVHGWLLFDLSDRAIVLQRSAGDPSFNHVQLGRGQLVLIRRHLRLFCVRNQTPQTRAVGIAWLQNRTRRTALPNGRETRQRKVALLGVLIVAAKAMLAKNGRTCSS